MDQQAANDSDCVHSQLASHGCDVVHLHNLASNQKQDAYRGVPEDQRSSVFIWKINQLSLLLLTGTYHMIIATSLMIASLRQSKKSLRGCPCSLMLPMIKPKQRENTTRPSALTPLTDPGTGIVSSRVCSLLPLSVNIVSFTVITTWTILLAYWVLYYVFQNKKVDSNIGAVNKFPFCHLYIAGRFNLNVC